MYSRLEYRVSRRVQRSAEEHFRSATYQKGKNKTEKVLPVQPEALRLAMRTVRTPPARRHVYKAVCFGASNAVHEGMNSEVESYP